jgi:hypothetical protein
MQNNNIKAELQLKSIELLQSSLSTPRNTNINISSYTFNISIESRGDATNKLIFVIVSVEIKDAEQTLLLGSLAVSCIFEIANFKEVIQLNSEGLVIIPESLRNTLNSIAISTTRGVLFSEFRGTFLHGAVLPIIDPTQITTDNPIR